MLLPVAISALVAAMVCFANGLPYYALLLIVVAAVAALAHRSAVRKAEREEWERTERDLELLMADDAPATTKSKTLPAQEASRDSKSEILLTDEVSPEPEVLLTQEVSPLREGPEVFSDREVVADPAIAPAGPVLDDREPPVAAASDDGWRLTRNLTDEERKEGVEERVVTNVQRRRTWAINAGLVFVMAIICFVSRLPSYGFLLIAAAAFFVLMHRSAVRRAEREEWERTERDIEPLINDDERSDPGGEVLPTEEAPSVSEREILPAEEAPLAPESETLLTDEGAPEPEVLLTQ